MLKSFEVKDYALIEHIFVQFGSGLNIITGVLIAAAISGGIHFLTFNPSFMGKLGRTYGNTGMIIEILVITPGIIIGIFWKIFHKINVIESQYEMIKHH